MAKNISIYLDGLFRRGKYLGSLNNRIDAFQDVQSSPSKRVIDDCQEAASVERFVIPEIEANALTVDKLKESMKAHGCLHVRNFFDPREVREMRAYIDFAYSVEDKCETTLGKYLSKPVDISRIRKGTKDDIRRNREENPTYTDTIKDRKKVKQNLGKGASLHAINTPVVAEKLLKVYERKGLRALLDNYFENDPCVSAFKWVLRKTVSPPNAIDFHQDGAFMGEQIDSVNCWSPFTNCGAGYDAPGMDIVPVRLKGDFAKGSGLLDWSIGLTSVLQKYGEEGIVTPTFKAGDLFFFDHMLVHRTQHTPERSGVVRHAIETWFFDSGNFPKNQIPIKW